MCLLGASAVFSTDSIPTGFYIHQRELIFLALEPWAGGPGVGLGLLDPKKSLLNFNLPHGGEGPASSESVPLPSISLDEFGFFNSKLSDFHSTQFLMAVSDGCSTF